MVDLRFAEPDDVVLLESIDECASNEFSSWVISDKQELRRMIFSREYSIVIAQDADRSIGYLQAVLDKNRTIRIERIYVKILYRKKGIAREMMNFFVAHWNAKGEKIVISVADPLVSLFEHLGFEKKSNLMEWNKTQ